MYRPMFFCQGSAKDKLFDMINGTL